MRTSATLSDLIEAGILSVDDELKAGGPFEGIAGTVVKSDGHGDTGEYKIKLSGAEKLQELQLKHLDGKEFSTLYDAASAVAGRPTSGLAFWRIGKQPVRDQIGLQPAGSQHDERSSSNVPNPQAKDSEEEPEAGEISSRRQKVELLLRDFLEQTIACYYREIPRYEALLRVAQEDIFIRLSPDDMIGVTSRIKRADSLEKKLQTKALGILDKMEARKTSDQSSNEAIGVDGEQGTSSKTDGVLMRIIETLWALSVRKDMEMQASTTGGDEDANLSPSTPRQRTQESQMNPSAELNLHAASEIPDLSAHQELLDSLWDLAGLRILVYRRRDMKYVVASYMAHWPSKDSDGDGEIELNPNLNFVQYEHRTPSDFKENDGTSLYQAYHLRLVYTSPRDPLTDLDRQLQSMKCEVQITLVSSHLINEVGHKVNYKAESSPESTGTERIAQSIPVDPEVKRGLHKRQEDMKKIDEQLEELFRKANVPEFGSGKVPEPLEGGGRRYLSWLSKSVDDSASILVRKSVLTRQLEFLKFFAEGSKQTDPVVNALALIKCEVEPQKVDDGTIDRYNDTTFVNEHPSCRMDPSQEVDRKFLSILLALPDEFLKDFQEKKGRVMPARGRPPMAVTMAGAALVINADNREKPGSASPAPPSNAAL